MSTIYHAPLIRQTTGRSFVTVEDACQFLGHLLYSFDSEISRRELVVLVPSIAFAFEWKAVVRVINSHSILMPQLHDPRVLISALW